MAQITVIFVGIAGPSGCGKSTYAKHLADHLQSPLYPIELDHFFHRPVIMNHSILGSIKSYEQPECLNLPAFAYLLHQIKENPKLITRYHRADLLVDENTTVFIIIIEGFLLFALSDKITNLFDIKIFLNSTLSECRLQRYRRRNKIPHTVSNADVIVAEKFQQWFDYLVWDEYLKRRDLQIFTADKVFHSAEYQQKQYTSLDDYIVQRIDELIMHQLNKNRNILSQL